MPDTAGSWLPNVSLVGCALASARARAGGEKRGRCCADNEQAAKLQDLPPADHAVPPTGVTWRGGLHQVAVSGG